MTDEFVYGEESGKLGGVPGVLRLKDGEELTLIVTGPMKETLDRFGNEAPKTKYALGVYNTNARERGIVILSWKAKKEWDAEDQKRPFKSHFVRWGRVGTGKEGTKYNISAFPGITDPHKQEAKASKPLPLGSFEATLAEVERRAREPRDATAAPQQGYAHPGNTPPVANANGHVPIPSGPGSAPVAAGVPAVASSAGAAASLDELQKIDNWLTNPMTDVPKVSDHLKKVLVTAVGKEKTIMACKNAGIVVGSGAVPTAEQLRKVIAEAMGILRPTSLAPAIAGDDDSIPF